MTPRQPQHCKACMLLPGEVFTDSGCERRHPNMPTGLVAGCNAWHANFAVQTKFFLGKSGINVPCNINSTRNDRYRSHVSVLMRSC